MKNHLKKHHNSAVTHEPHWCLEHSYEIMHIFMFKGTNSNYYAKNIRGQITQFGLPGGGLYTTGVV